ncbi:MAG TPA: NAD-dependent epimerase/dehydratase family protein [Sedimenticola sp.]|nr:NAD-dependent epimerase/dehydratase family protein [Sedimenticola sp.]
MTEHPPTVALTGASGFIGGRIARKLCSAGFRVRALVRSPARATRLLQPEVTLVPGSLERLESLRELVRGCSAVIHCAGAVRGVTQAQFDQVNVKGVQRIARAAREQSHPPRFLALSSLAAREPGLSPYAASKRRGEEALAECAADMPWMALRPPAVYGPGDRELLPLFRIMARGLAPLVAPPGARFSVIYVDDLADAVLQWLQREPVAEGVYELHDGRPGGYGWDDVIEAVEAVTGRRARPLRIPRALLQLPALVNWAAGRLLPYAPMLTPGKVRELRHRDWVADNRAITANLGWTPRTDLREGLQLTPGWRHDGD